jgi:hypothetical protein
MSEYQYYEFQAIDRPLSVEEQAEVRALSSRAVVSPTRACFEYNYGDFKADPLDVLVNYFDVMFHIAYWGTIQLMFRFPKEFINIGEMSSYCVKDMINIRKVDDSVILEICYCYEEGFGWIEGEDHLPVLLSLRNDILNGDYRLLYIAWLNTLQFRGSFFDELEPPVPSGLQELPRSLRHLKELCELDEILLRTASKTSPVAEKLSDDELLQSIEKLSREECNNYLVRLIKREPHLNLRLKRSLSEKISDRQTKTAPIRKISDLLKLAEAERREEAKRISLEKERIRLKELQELDEKKDKTWDLIEELINTYKPEAYEEAVQLIVKLKELAEYKKQFSHFQKHLNQVLKKYKNRPSLMSRFMENGLKPGKD